MTDSRFSRLESQLQTKVPVLSTANHVAVFFKQKNTEDVSYTAAVNGNLMTFVAEDFSKPHRHDFFELMIVRAGTVRNLVGKRMITYHAGEGCLMNRQLVHQEFLEAGAQVMFVDLSVGLLQSLFENTDLKGEVFAFLQHNLDAKADWKRSYLEFTNGWPMTNRALWVVLDSLQLECSTKKIGARYFQSGLVLRLLALLQNPNDFSLRRVDVDASKETYLVGMMTRMIAAKFGAINRSEIADHLHYNAEYLNRLFKKHTGNTLLEYAKAIRIQKAQQLLTQTALSITDIAQQLKFSSAEYFYRTFKQAVGESPQQYRQKLGHARLWESSDQVEHSREHDQRR